ncbi:MAG: DUF898 domain-containing protein [Burkholderiales bacterium]|nr:DUF898 domain-containing protein [Burkholderiales bacterium]
MIDADSPILRVPLEGAIASAEAPETTPLRLEFQGSAREYFRIWIINLCLTLLTLSLFSAWAKVRRKRYFYSHTRLDGTPFQYLGQPIPIFKGRLVAFALFGIYWISGRFYTPAVPFVIVGLVLLAPWVVVRSAAFNARYSVYRNIPFRFDAQYLDAARVLVAWGLTPLAVIGFVLSERLQNPKMAVLMGLGFGLIALFFPVLLQRLKKLLVTYTRYGGKRATFGATGSNFYGVYFRAGLIVMASGIVTGLAIFLIGMGRRTAPALLVLSVIPIYAGYAFAFAYVQARIGNLTWNKTQLGPLRFESTLKPLGLAGLYLTNALGVLASFGLAIPWAVVRTHRYRIDHLRVLADGELSGFRSDVGPAVSAAGAEVGEFFDLDLSL